MLTVVTPAEDASLVSLSRVQAELGTSVSGDRLEYAIAQASGAIATYCNRVFARELVAETFRFRCPEDGLLLTRCPVTEITSIVENGETLAVEDYELSSGASGLLIRLSSDRECTWPAGKIVVTYRAGYELPNGAPDAVGRAAVQLVNYYLNFPQAMQRSFDVPGVMAATMRDFPEGCTLPPEIAALIDDFRLPIAG